VDWRWVSQVRAAPGAQIGKRLIGQRIQPARRDIPFQLLIPRRRIEPVKPLAESPQLRPGQFRNRLFDFATVLMREMWKLRPAGQALESLSSLDRRAGRRQFQSA
jgi:hypothetical protein